MLIPIIHLTLALAASPRDPQTLPVLIITGANNHAWEYTSVELKETLEASGRFTVDVTTTPADFLADASKLAAYRAVVLDYNGPRWGAAAEENFLDAVRAGLGVAVIHASNNAFPGWVEYEQLVALCWRPGTGHGSFHSFEVQIDDREHPITRGLPDLVEHPDELYHRLAHMHETEHRVLASAYSDPATRGTGEKEPMVIVKRFGLGRIFHTPLGHVGGEATRVSHTDPQFKALVVRGVEWAATGRVSDGTSQPNRLSALERAAGWRLLFDGESLDGWHSFGSEEPPAAGWEVIDGCLVHRRRGGGGDIVFEEQPGDFELELEWKVTPGANSGIKYRVPPRPGGGGMLGHEYQVLDDGAHPDGRGSLSSAGAVYALFPAVGKSLRPVGEFNHTRIVARGERIEHWLNGERVVSFEIGSEDWQARVDASKFRSAAGFGRAARGYIGLQDHGDEVWYRTIKLRDLDALPGEAVELIGDAELSDWRMIGEALYSVEADSILGVSAPSGRHTFLATRQSYGDFILEVDVKPEEPGNSGIQVRSSQAPDGHVQGYQIEIDSSPRAWSAGLYDEGRRGWLDDLSDRPAAREAFRFGEWNRYRIECIGPSIRTWINGVPAADHFDPLDLEGFIALQVHGGRNTRVRWGAPRLWDLGRRSWIERPTPARLEHAGAGAQHALGAGPRLRASLGRELNEGALRMQINAAGPFGLAFESEGASPSRRAGALELSPGLHVWPGGWLLDATRLKLPGWRADGENTLSVCFFGGRLALHVGGKLALDQGGLPQPEDGALGLELWGPGHVELSSLEALSEALP